MEELLQGFWGGVIGDMIAVIFVLCHFLGKNIIGNLGIYKLSILPCLPWDMSDTS